MPCCLLLRLSITVLQQPRQVKQVVCAEQAAPTPSHAPQANQSLSHHSSQPLDASALQQARPRSRPTWRHPSRVHPSSLNQLPSQILNSPPGHDHARVARDMCARSDPARRKANEQSPASALQADPDPEQSGAELQPASLHGDNAQAVLGAAQAQKGAASAFLPFVTTCCWQ